MIEAPVFPYQETRRGDTSALRDWLTKGGHINAPLNHSVAETWTPLMLACAEGNVALVRAIIEVGGARASASVGTKVLASSKPLHVAARYGHAGVASVLLELGAVVDARDSTGLTPLHYAAGNGHLRAIEVLLGAGAAADATASPPPSGSSSGGTTPSGETTAIDMADMAGFDDAAALLRSQASVAEARGAAAGRKALGSWLEAVGCGEYLGRFLRAGYDDLSFMASQGITEEDLDCVGVPREKLGLRKKLSAMHGVERFLDATRGGRSSSSGGADGALTAETASQSEGEVSSSGSRDDDNDDDEEAGSDESEDVEESARGSGSSGSDGEEPSSSNGGSDGDSDTDSESDA